MDEVSSTHAVIEKVDLNYLRHAQLLGHNETIVCAIHAYQIPLLTRCHVYWLYNITTCVAYRISVWLIFWNILQGT